VCDKLGGMHTNWGGWVQGLGGGFCIGGTEYRSFLQRAGHCISQKPLNKDYLCESVSQLYLNKPGNAYAMSSPLQEGPVQREITDGE
jgi:hypothetical protein